MSIAFFGPPPATQTNQWFAEKKYEQIIETLKTEDIRSSYFQETFLRLCQSIRVPRGYDDSCVELHSIGVYDLFLKVLEESEESDIENDVDAASMVLSCLAIFQELITPASLQKYASKFKDGKMFSDLLTPRFINAWVRVLQPEMLLSVIDKKKSGKTFIRFLETYAQDANHKLVICDMQLYTFTLDPVQLAGFTAFKKALSKGLFLLDEKYYPILSVMLKDTVGLSDFEDIYDSMHHIPAAPMQLSFIYHMSILIASSQINDEAIIIICSEIVNDIKSTIFIDTDDGTTYSTYSREIVNVLAYICSKKLYYSYETLVLSSIQSDDFKGLLVMDVDDNIYSVIFRIIADNALREHNDFSLRIVKNLTEADLLSHAFDLLKKPTVDLPSFETKVCISFFMITMIGVVYLASSWRTDEHYSQLVKKLSEPGICEAIIDTFSLKHYNTYYEHTDLKTTYNYTVACVTVFMFGLLYDMDNVMPRIRYDKSKSKVVVSESPDYQRISKLFIDQGELRKRCLFKSSNGRINTLCNQLLFFNHYAREVDITKVLQIVTSSNTDVRFKCNVVLELVAYDRFTDEASVNQLSDFSRSISYVASSQLVIMIEYAKAKRAGFIRDAEIASEEASVSLNATIDAEKAAAAVVQAKKDAAALLLKQGREQALEKRRVVAKAQKTLSEQQDLRAREAAEAATQARIAAESALMEAEDDEMAASEQFAALSVAVETEINPDDLIASFAELFSKQIPDRDDDWKKQVFEVLNKAKAFFNGNRYSDLTPAVFQRLVDYVTAVDRGVEPRAASVLQPETQPAPTHQLGYCPDAECRFERLRSLLCYIHDNYDGFDKVYYIRPIDQLCALWKDVIKNRLRLARFNDPIVKGHSTHLFIANFNKKTAWSAKKICNYLRNCDVHSKKVFTLAEYTNCVYLRAIVDLFPYIPSLAEELATALEWPGETIKRKEKPYRDFLRASGT